MDQLKKEDQEKEMQEKDKVIVSVLTAVIAVLPSGALISSSGHVSGITNVTTWTNRRGTIKLGNQYIIISAST